MLDYYASNYITIYKTLELQAENAEMVFELEEKSNEAVLSQAEEELLKKAKKNQLEFLTRLKIELKSLRLDQSLLLCEELIAFLTPPEKPLRSKDFATTSTMLGKILKNELSSRVFYYVRPDLIEFYLNNQFGEHIVKKFPKARFDMEEAGKCLAMGRFPACVFHLMRIIDLALKRLGQTYEIKPKNPNWMEYMRPLREKYDALKKSNPEEAQVLGDILERFAAYAGIRNPVSHSDELLPSDSIHCIEKKYTEEEARRHFENVKAFMETLYLVVS